MAYHKTPIKYNVIHKTWKKNLWSWKSPYRKLLVFLCICKHPHATLSCNLTWGVQSKFKYSLYLLTSGRQLLCLISSTLSNVCLKITLEKPPSVLSPGRESHSRTIQFLKSTILSAATLRVSKQSFRGALGAAVLSQLPCPCFRHCSLTCWSMKEGWKRAVSLREGCSLVRGLEGKKTIKCYLSTHGLKGYSKQL